MKPVEKVFVVRQKSDDFLHCIFAAEDDAARYVKEFPEYIYEPFCLLEYHGDATRPKEQP